MKIKSLLLTIMMIQSITVAQFIEDKSLPLWDFESIRTMAFSDSLNGWTMSNTRLFRTDNGGKTWNVINTPHWDGAEDFAVLKIVPFGQMKAFIQTGLNLYSTIDGGISWESVRFDYYTSDRLRISFINENTGWISFVSGYDDGERVLILKTTDSGKSWNVQSQFPKSYYGITSMQFMNANIGWLTLEHNIYYTADGGTSWLSANIQDSSLISSSRISALTFVDEHQGWAITNNDYLLKTIDGGKNWLCKKFERPYSFLIPDINYATGTEYKMKFLNSKYGVILFNNSSINALIYKTSDGGETWEKYPASNLSSNNDVEFYPPEKNLLLDKYFLFISGGYSLLKANILSSVYKSISILPNQGEKIFKTGGTLPINWQLNDKNLTGKLICKFYLLWNNPYLGPAEFSSDTIDVTTLSLNKKISLPINDRIVYNIFYRLYMPDNINTDEISEQIIVRQSPKIELQPPTYSGHLFIGDTCKINFRCWAIENLKVQYSTNNGTSWSDIQNPIKADSNNIVDKKINWVIPSVFSSNGYIRVVSLDDTSVFAQSARFEVSFTKQIAVFPLKKGNTWFYKHTYTQYPDLYGGGYTDSPLNLYYRITTGEEVSKEDGKMYFPFIISIWNDTAKQSDKFSYVGTRYYRQSGNQVYQYGSTTPWLNFEQSGDTSKILDKNRLTFRIVMPAIWESVTDSIGITELNCHNYGTRSGSYERNYLVGYVLDGKLRGEILPDKNFMQPVLLFPSSGSRVATSKITYKWSKYKDAWGYRFILQELIRDHYSSSPSSWTRCDSTITDTLLTFTATKDSTKYRWIVEALVNDYAIPSNVSLFYKLKSVIPSDTTHTDTTKTDTSKVLPKTYALYQNYPNPFNPSTTIEYSIPDVGTLHAVSVQLKVYDMLGREVATLVNEEKAPGNYEVKFDGSNLSSGVYLYRIRAGSFNQTKKIVLLK